jgi:GNAT superfamily N-acetyltransferase
MTIRNYEARDLEECRGLWRQLTDWHREIYQNETIGGEHPESHFDRHIAAVGPSQVWVAVHDSRAIGFVGLILKEGEAEVEPLIVSRTYRGRGVGKRLMEKVVAEARGRGVRYLNIRPVARNVKTIQFLRKQGFANVGFIELFMDFSKGSWRPELHMFGYDFNT